MKRIYVAGQLSNGDRLTKEQVEVNVNTAIQVADELLQAGYSPYIPHLTWYWHQRHPHDWQTWIDHDLEWLRQCEALIRLSGESQGADREGRIGHQAGHSSVLQRAGISGGAAPGG